MWMSCFFNTFNGLRAVPFVSGFDNISLRVPRFGSMLYLSPSPPTNSPTNQPQPPPHSGSVESVKAASDVYAPVGGTVIEINDVLSDEPGTINTAAETEGWFIKVEVRQIVKKIRGRPKGCRPRRCQPRNCRPRRCQPRRLPPPPLLS